MPVFAWTMPLRDFMGLAGVTRGENGGFSRGTISAIDAFAKKVEDDGWEPHPCRPELEYAVEGAQMALRSATNKTVVAGFSLSLVVRPDYAGHGLGVEAQYLRTYDMEGFRADAYTEAGFGAMRATHRLHVQRAHDAGIEIPDDVKADYRIEDGRVILRNDYTIEDHQARIDAIISQSARDVHAALQEVHEEMFTRPQDLLARSGFDHLGTLRGYSLLRPAALDHNFPIICVTRNDMLVQVYLETPYGRISPYGVMKDGPDLKHPREVIDPDCMSYRSVLEGFFMKKIPVDDPFAPDIEHRFESDAAFKAALEEGFADVPGADAEVIWKLEDLPRRARQTGIPRRIEHFLQSAAQEVMPV